MIYHVVYMTEYGIGTITVKLRLPIKTTDDVKVVADIIKKETKASTALVLNWKKLER